MDGGLPVAVRTNAALRGAGPGAVAGRGAGPGGTVGAAPLPKRVAGAGRLAADGVVGPGPRSLAVPPRSARPSRRRRTCQSADPRAGAPAARRSLGALVGV